MLKNAHQGAEMLKINTAPTVAQVKAAIKRGNSAYVRIDTENSEYWELVHVFHPAIDADHIDLVETHDGNLYSLDAVEVHTR